MVNKILKVLELVAPEARAAVIANMIEDKFFSDICPVAAEIDILLADVEYGESWNLLGEVLDLLS